MGSPLVKLPLRCSQNRASDDAESRKLSFRFTEYSKTVFPASGILGSLIGSVRLA